MKVFSALSRAALASPVLAALASAAAAQDAASCYDRAVAAADEWSAGQVMPLADANTADPGNYVAILYGRKFQAPYNRPGTHHVIRHYLGDLVSWRNKIYRDEYRACTGENDDRIFFVVSGQ